MLIASLDLEGVLIPEIWVGLAHKTQISELTLTTREIPDYDVLMKKRLSVLNQHHLSLKEIQEVVADLDPLPGAQDFVKWLRSEMFQVIILSDTFYEFTHPLMAKFDYPTLFCHRLQVGDGHKIEDYFLRLPDQKTKAVKAFQDLNFKVVATGDSYNDIGMLTQANYGIFFKPPEQITKDYPLLPVASSYEDLKKAFLEAKHRLLA